jgi:hypothetical protein
LFLERLRTFATTEKIALPSYFFLHGRSLWDKDPANRILHHLMFVGNLISAGGMAPFMERSDCAPDQKIEDRQQYQYDNNSIHSGPALSNRNPCKRFPSNPSRLRYTYWFS